MQRTPPLVRPGVFFLDSRSYRFVRTDITGEDADLPDIWPAEVQ